MTGTERLEEIPLAKIQEWHKEGRRGDGSPSYCVACKQDWPCDTVLVLAEVERLRGVVTKARARAEGIKAALNIGQPGAASLGVFGLVDDLAELEGKG